MTQVKKRETPLITRGSGFIGRHLFAEVSDRYDVIVLDVDEPESLETNVTFYRCDLTKDESVPSLFHEIEKRGVQQIQA